MAGTLPHLSAVFADMVRLQCSTGMRPGEVVLLRTIDVDTSGEVWVFTPESHKTEHHGRRREVYIGPRSQAILRPYMDRPIEEYCFRSDRTGRASRKTRRFRRDTYTTAVMRACRRAFPVRKGMPDGEAETWKRRHWWTPNQLRHAFATEVRREHGLEAAQVVLGHACARITEVYAERDHAKGESVVRMIG